MKIDAGVYFWKYEKANRHPFIGNHKLLQQHYFPEQISQSLHRNGIDGCVAVVAEEAEVETRFLCELAATHPTILGVVGRIDLYEPNATDKIKEFKIYPPIRGYCVEIKKNSFPDPAVMELLQENQYSLDVILSDETDVHLLSDWLGRYPGINFILQDGGNPDTKQPPAKEWEQRIVVLAKNANLYCKVSGMMERGHMKSWKPADFYPFLEILFENFPPDRLLFASNWPFILVAGMYVQWKSLLEKFTEKFTEDNRENFFGENARRLYRL